MDGTGKVGERFGEGRLLCGAFGCRLLEVSKRLWGTQREVVVLAQVFAVGLLSSWGMSKLLV